MTSRRSGKKLDIIAGDQVGAGPLGFRDLSVELRLEPKIVVVKKSDPFTFGTFDSCIAGAANIAFAKLEIQAPMSRRYFPACSAHIIAFPVGNDDDFVISKRLCPHAMASASISGRLCVGMT